MMVKDLIYVLEHTLPILKQYDTYTVSEMLADIYSKISPSNLEQPRKKRKAQPEVDYNNLVSKLETMHLDEIHEFLSQFKKEELIQIGKLINIELQPKDRKTTLINSIANHYSFIQLNGQMANRNHQKREIKVSF